MKEEILFGIGNNIEAQDDYRTILLIDILVYFIFLPVIVIAYISEFSESAFWLSVYGMALAYLICLIVITSFIWFYRHFKKRYSSNETSLAITANGFLLGSGKRINFGQEEFLFITRGVSPWDLVYLIPSVYTGQPMLDRKLIIKYENKFLIFRVSSDEMLKKLVVVLKELGYKHTGMKYLFGAGLGKKFLFV